MRPLHPSGCRPESKAIFYGQPSHPARNNPFPLPDRDRTVFFVSDGTGLTAEALGHSLLTQFDGVEFTPAVMPFIDSRPSARGGRRASAGPRRRRERGRSCSPPWSTTPCARSCARPTRWCSTSSRASSSPLEAELGTRSTHTIGRVAQRRGNAGVPVPHRGDQLHAGPRRRSVAPRPRAGRRHPGRRLAQRQDADLPLPGACSSASRRPTIR